MVKATYIPDFDFYPWLNKRTSDNDNRPWEDLGLKPDAPKEAVEAYEKYCVLQADALKRGIKL